MSGGPPTASAGGSADPAPTQKWVVDTYQRLNGELETVSTRLLSLEEKHREHSLVCETLRPLDEARRCYQLLGGVLVERTVKEMLPELEANCAKYKQARVARTPTARVRSELSMAKYLVARSRKPLPRTAQFAPVPSARALVELCCRCCSRVPSNSVPRVPWHAGDGAASNTGEQEAARA